MNNEMTKEEQRKIQNDALNIHGIVKQQWMLVEECGELLNAIAKSKRDRAGKDEIITELADVSIIVEQMAFFYGEEDFEKEKERKLLRLKERLHGTSIGHNEGVSAPGKRSPERDKGHFVKKLGEILDKLEEINLDRLYPALDEIAGMRRELIKLRKCGENIFRRDEASDGSAGDA